MNAKGQKGGDASAAVGLGVYRALYLRAPYKDRVINSQERIWALHPPQPAFAIKDGARLPPDLRQTSPPGYRRVSLQYIGTMIEARELAWVKSAHTAGDIARGIEGDIAAGRLAPGDKLPSPDFLSKTTGVPVSIGRLAYENLAEAGFVHARRQGTFVAANQVAAPGEIIAVAERLATLGVRLGVGSRTLETLVRSAMNDIDAYDGPLDDFSNKELRA